MGGEKKLVSCSKARRAVERSMPPRAHNAECQRALASISDFSEVTAARRRLCTVSLREEPDFGGPAASLMGTAGLVGVATSSWSRIDAARCVVSGGQQHGSQRRSAVVIGTLAGHTQGQAQFW